MRMLFSYSVSTFNRVNLLAFAVKEDIQQAVGCFAIPGNIQPLRIIASTSIFHRHEAWCLLECIVSTLCRYSISWMLVENLAACLSAAWSSLTTANAKRKKIQFFFNAQVDMHLKVINLLAFVLSVTESYYVRYKTHSMKLSLSAELHTSVVPRAFSTVCSRCKYSSMHGSKHTPLLGLRTSCNVQYDHRRKHHFCSSSANRNDVLK